MKRYFIFFALALACSLGVKAQGISVADFYLATNDLTANTYGTEQFDQNGERCALIKIETTQKGFAFNVGSLGVTKVEEDHVGEIWVYVPHSVRRITIQHAQLGTLRDYYFPVAIESSRTYIMQLTAGNVTTIVEQDLGGSYLVMKVQPVSAMVFIDEQLRELKNDGSLSLLLPYGKHTYSVQAPNFISKSGVFNVGTQKVTLEIELQSSKAYITLQTKMSDAKIYLNDEYLGQGSWTGYLSAGMYLAEARKDGYRSTREPFSIAEREERTITIPDPIAIYGKLQVESDPVECEVWIDGKKVGTTPDLFSNLLAGNHNLSLVKNGYETIEQTVNIEEARISTVKLSLQPVAQKKTYVPSTQQEAPVAKPTPNVESNQKPAPQQRRAALEPVKTTKDGYDVLITSNRNGLTVSDNGTVLGVTPLTANLTAGKHDLAVSNRYFGGEKTVTIKPSTRSVNIKSTRQTFDSKWAFMGIGLNSFSALAPWSSRELSLFSTINSYSSFSFSYFTEYKRWRFSWVEFGITDVDYTYCTFYNGSVSDSEETDIYFWMGSSVGLAMRATPRLQVVPQLGFCWFADSYDDDYSRLYWRLDIEYGIRRWVSVYLRYYGDPTIDDTAFNLGANFRLFYDKMFK